MWRSPLRLFPPVRRCSSLLLLILHHLLLLLMLSTAVAPFKPPPGPAPPVFTSTMEREVVTVGDNALLRCQVNYDKQYKVVWSFNGETLTFNDKRVVEDTRFSVQRLSNARNVWDLHIKRVQEADEGDYLCFVNTKPVQKRTVRLVVRVPPRITSNPVQQIEVLSEDHSLRVDCRAEGRPQPTITWTREKPGKKFIPISTDRTDDLYVQGDQLVIVRAKRWMNGVFACTATNGIFPPALKRVTLTVNYRPVVRYVNSRIGQQLGGVTMLQCRVESSPMGDVSWEFNGSPINPPPKPCSTIPTGQRMCKEILFGEKNPERANVDLTIRNVTGADYGDYACVATSSLGTSRAIATLYKIIPNDVIVYMSRRYQNDAGRGLNAETPAPSTRKRGPDAVEIQNTGKPHISGGRSGGDRLHLSAFLQTIVVAILLLRLPSSSRL